VTEASDRKRTLINVLVSIIMSSRVRECTCLARTRNPLTLRPSREGWNVLPTCRQAAANGLRVAVDSWPLQLCPSAFERNTEYDAAPFFRPTAVGNPCFTTGPGTAEYE
jgi:hypothetical protein